MKQILTLALMCALASCGAPKNAENPFFASWDTPFGTPPFEQIKPEHFKPAFEEGMRVERAEIDSITRSIEIPTFENTILAYDRSGELYGRVGRVFGTLTSADTTPELEAIKTEMSPLQSAHSDAIALDGALFAKIKTVYDARLNSGLDAAQLRLTEKVYNRFVRGGALLDEAGKEQLKSINAQLSALSIRFDANNRGAVNSYALVIGPRETEGLPAGVIAAARQRATDLGHPDSLAFTLSKPSWIPFLTYSENEQHRRTIYQAWLAQCAEGSEYDNTQIINDIIRLRTEKARLLGFDTYADFVLDERMAKTPAKVYEFLDALWTPALASATDERDRLESRKYFSTGDSLAVLDASDWWFYAEKERSRRFDFDEERARPYFSLDNVREGIFLLCNKLYGITFRPLPDAPVYNKDVVVYEVRDIDDSHLGVIYMDFFPRAGKGSGAWCSSLRSQGYDAEGNKISPITTITCNFTEPVEGAPSLLTLDETETFFHEFGHAIHNLFADVPYQGLLGTERDFVELPSQIMENWAFTPQMLDAYAIHYRTGEKIPADMIRRIGESALFNQGFMTTELLAAALSDMDIHSMKEYEPFNVAEFERNALTIRRGLIPQVEPRYHYPYFSHIFDGGYAAGYYSYIWAEVLDKDAYEAFVETGDIFDKKVANDFRYKVLAPRGMKDGMELYRDFRGAEPSREPLLKGRGLVPKPASDTVLGGFRVALSAMDRLAEGELLPAPPDSVLRQILGEEPLEK